jgi:hypothetical protein
MRPRKHFAVAAFAAMLLVAGFAACGGGAERDGASSAETAAALPQGGQPVELDPADFTTQIDNPYWPMRPGARWVYREDPGARRIVVEVTGETRRIANGVEALVVSDVVTRHGEPVEVTHDWYAQDSAGNVWYLGEDTAEYENGRVATRAGSFEAGADGAQAGIIMPARPRVGMAYRQEYLKGQAEDRAEILSVGADQASVPAGHFAHTLMTRELTRIEPDTEEIKFYGRGVGPVLALTTSGGTDRERLVSYRPGR